MLYDRRVEWAPPVTSEYPPDEGEHPPPLGDVSQLFADSIIINGIDRRQDVVPYPDDHGGPDDQIGSLAEVHVHELSCVVVS